MLFPPFFIIYNVVYAEMGSVNPLFILPDALNKKVCFFFYQIENNFLRKKKLQKDLQYLLLALWVNFAPNLDL